eukprot:4686809-Prymnesium_polylepis.1
MLMRSDDFTRPDSGAWWRAMRPTTRASRWASPPATATGETYSALKSSAAWLPEIVTQVDKDLPRTFTEDALQLD